MIAWLDEFRASSMTRQAVGAGSFRERGSARGEVRARRDDDERIVTRRLVGNKFKNDLSQSTDVRTPECLVLLDPGQPPLRLGPSVPVVIGAPADPSPSYMTLFYLGTTVSTVPIFLVTWRLARRFGRR